MVPPHYTTGMIPSASTAPVQITKFTPFSSVSELALASVSWGSHQVARQLPKPMRGGHSRTQGDEVEWQQEQFLTPAQWGLLELIHHSSSAVPSLQGKLSWEPTNPWPCQRAVFRPVSLLTPTCYELRIPLSNAHAILFPGVNIHWTEILPRAYLTNKCNGFKTKSDKAVSKKSKKRAWLLTGKPVITTWCSSATSKSTAMDKSLTMYYYMVSTQTISNHMWGECRLCFCSFSWCNCEHSSELAPRCQSSNYSTVGNSTVQPDQRSQVTVLLSTLF